MYTLETKASFDSAHFLADYKGKCSNIHGHRWNLTAIIKDEKLEENGQTRGMIVDFGILKKDLKAVADMYDHCLIIEKGTMRELTYNALIEDGFKIIQVDFRPTAENFAKYFFEVMEKKGYNMLKMIVYETPNNCAAYSK